MTAIPANAANAQTAPLGGGACCPTCSKPVYPFERLLVDGVSFHRACFRCVVCNTTLKPSNFYTTAGRYYCKTHYVPASSLSPRGTSTSPASSTSPATSAILASAPQLTVPQSTAPPSVATATAAASTTSKPAAQPSASPAVKPQLSDSKLAQGSPADSRSDKKDKKEKKEKKHSQRPSTSVTVSPLPISAPAPTVDQTALIDQLTRELRKALDEIGTLKAEVAVMQQKRQQTESALAQLQSDFAAAKTAADKDSMAVHSKITAVNSRLQQQIDALESQLQAHEEAQQQLLQQQQSKAAAAAATPAAASSSAQAAPKAKNNSAPAESAPPLTSAMSPNGGAAAPEKKKREAKAVRFSEEPENNNSTGGGGKSEPAPLKDSAGDSEDGPDEPGAEIKKQYKFKRKIGKGATSVVYEGKHKKTGRKVAIKKIKKAHIKDDDALLREFHIVKELHHPNIVEFYESFEDSENHYLVMELVEGKELFEKILEKGFYSEQDTVNIVRQLIDAIVYLHDKGIAHRDLKPENLLTSGEGSTEVVKVTDFGLSKCFKEAPLKTMCGSSVYISPEVVEGNPYDKAVDMWSLGVIVYILLCGYPPWKNPPEKAAALIKEIIGCQYSFHEEDWKDISPEAKDFISHLLVKDPNQRFTAHQAKAHPWLSRPLENRSSTNSSLERSVSRLKIFLRGDNVPQDWEVTYSDIHPSLGQPIAEGAFAFVYKIQFKGKPVAVKKMKFEKDETDEDEMTEDFKKEVQLMSTLKHENIVQFVGACIHFPNLCIIIDWYNRGSLNDLLHKKSVEFPWELRMKLCREVAAGLSYLHTRTPKIIHRDVKAENVFIDDDWTAKLGDFGLSKVKLDSKAQVRRIESMRAVGRMYKTPLESRIEISKSGTVGTPAWIAPEILDMKPYSERADVYSYGVFLWEMLTRKLPHSDKGDYSIAMGVLVHEERPEIPSDTPPKFAQLTQECWRTKSEERPSCADIMAVFAKYGDRIEGWY